ncbi:GNAT family N-acetyltransferase [Mucilaginibacter hurinus]|uniref:GNAT family N-acetyltransferase n=1 Tax=Mucilaginibacter hurinus TaxID=2201324 RepID=A0A367GRD1_9SPHI|nr:GNAT family N-acetyltransferase [Mucilaginibacter hurinus]RCH56019.1 GNAT family N-acetyltransferase [Mucilaginibacter hurinus]
MIRQAKQDDAPAIARLIIAAMGELAAKFVNGTNPEQAIPLFERFAALPANQYSYQGTLVYEDAHGICGMINGYDGALLHQLRAEFLNHIKSVYNNPYHPEDETGPGEFYIDCLSVAPVHQGKGIGRQLLSALCQRAKSMGHSTAGLLVNKENPRAEKLYQTLGFAKVGDKVLLGTLNHHLQISLS